MSELNNEFVSISEESGEVDNLNLNDNSELLTKLRDIYKDPNDGDIDFYDIKQVLDDFNVSIENWINIDWEIVVWDELDETINGKLVEVNKLINDYINWISTSELSLKEELSKILNIKSSDFKKKPSFFLRTMKGLHYGSFGTTSNI